MKRMLSSEKNIISIYIQVFQCEGGESSRTKFMLTKSIDFSQTEQTFANDKIYTQYSP